MTLDWQNAIAGLIVAAAVAYVVRTTWRAIARRKTGCGACPACPAGKSEPAVVSLEPLKKREV